MNYKNEYVLNIDIKKSTTNIVPTFLQYDTAVLIFKIYDNGKEFNLENFKRAEILHKLPNSEVVYGVGQLITLPNNQKAIKYEYLGSEMSLVGNVSTSLTVFSSDDTKVSILPFNVRIVKNIREDAGEQVRKEYSILEQLVAGAEDIVADARAATQRVEEAMQEMYANLDVIEAIAQEEVQRQNNEIARKLDMDRRIHRGAYSNTAQYYIHNEVLYNGSTYRCLVDSIGVLPTNTSNWVLVSQKGTDGAGSVSSVAGKTGAVVLTKSDVGLGNVTNESKATMFTSPTFTGAPTAPTATNGTNNTQIATTAFVQNAITNLNPSNPNSQSIIISDTIPASQGTGGIWYQTLD